MTTSPHVDAIFPGLPPSWLAVVFPLGKSKNCGAALKIAQAADYHMLIDAEGTRMAAAAFGLGKAEEHRANALLALVQRWKATMVFAKGSHVYTASRAIAFKKLWRF